VCRIVAADQLEVIAALVCLARDQGGLSSGPP